MAYDAYGRSQRTNGEPGYFSNDSSSPDFSQYSEPRDSYSSDHRPHPSSNSRQPKMPAPDRAGSIAQDVSPELIAAITARVKAEVVEHLRQTGNVDGQVPPPLRQQSSVHSNSSSPPPPETARRVYTPPSPAQAPKQSNYIPQSKTENMRSPPASPLDKPSTRYSEYTRPSAARTFSTVELSTIDQKWDRLFDNEGNPTSRLGQFLRGLANHVISEYTPKKSIVVTPSKMAAYYADHSLENEIHPLLSIFKAQSNEEISNLYQDLGCQHHLVQDQPSNPPSIPALTAVGFAHWMTIFLLAYPDAESKRLEKVVLALPIDADGPMVDGKPERLPKQISRHLLPDKEDRKSRKLVEEAITTFFNNLGSTDRRKAAITPPPLSRHASSTKTRSRPVEVHQNKASPPAPKTQPLERERNPYTGAPSAASDTSSNDDAVPHIERTRQPYSAHPGNGKVYAEPGSSTAGSRIGRTNSISRSRASTQTNEPRHDRTHSNTSQNYVPLPRAGGRRTSSPPIKKYSDSTPIDIGGFNTGPPLSTSSSHFPQSSNPFAPSSYGTSSSTVPPPPPPMDPRDLRARDDRHYRRGNEEDIKLAGDFNSPRDAERWDRFQENRTSDTDRPYESRASVSSDPRGSRGAPYEDWFRDPSSTRGSGYDGDRRY